SKSSAGHAGKATASAVSSNGGGLTSTRAAPTSSGGWLALGRARAGAVPARRAATLQRAARRRRTALCWLGAGRKPLDACPQGRPRGWTACPSSKTTRRPRADGAFWHWGDGAQDGPHSSWGLSFYPDRRP